MHIGEREVDVMASGRMFVNSSHTISCYWSSMDTPSHCVKSLNKQISKVEKITVTEQRCHSLSNGVRFAYLFL